MDKDWDWKEFGIEYDEGAEDIDESLAGLNGDGENFVLGLTDTPADSERSLLLKTLQRRHDHCPPSSRHASTAANEYSISTRSGRRVVASRQYLNNRHTRFQCSLRLRQVVPTLSTQTREPELDADHAVIVIEDTNRSSPDSLPHNPLRNAANGHSISSRPLCSTHHQVTSCQHLNNGRILVFDSARPCPDHLTSPSGQTTK